MMIRQPTPDAVAYAWWRRATSGERMARSEGDPQPGYYRLKNLRGGPWVAVAIWIESEIDPETGELTAPEQVMAIANGRPVNPDAIWLSARPISREEYDGLTGVRERIPDMIDTDRAIDLGHMAAIRP